MLIIDGDKFSGALGDHHVVIHAAIADAQALGICHGWCERLLALDGELVDMWRRWPSIRARFCLPKRASEHFNALRVNGPAYINHNFLVSMSEALEVSRGAPEGLTKAVISNRKALLQALEAADGFSAIEAESTCWGQQPESTEARELLRLYREAEGRDYELADWPRLRHGRAALAEVSR